MNATGSRSNNGRWVVAALIVISMFMAYLRWAFVPKSNPRKADPGSPFYSKPSTKDGTPAKAAE